MTKVVEGKIPELQKQLDYTLANAARLAAELQDERLAPHVALCCAAIIAEVTGGIADIKESLDWLSRSLNSQPQVLSQAIVDCTLARATQRHKHQVDLLNQAVRTADGDLDIWGNQLPRGGLWDK